MKLFMIFDEEAHRYILIGVNEDNEVELIDIKGVGCSPERIIEELNTLDEGEDSTPREIAERVFLSKDALSDDNLRKLIYEARTIDQLRRQGFIFTKKTDTGSYYEIRNFFTMVKSLNEVHEKTASSVDDFLTSIASIEKLYCMKRAVEGSSIPESVKPFYIIEQNGVYLNGENILHPGVFFGSFYEAARFKSEDDALSFVLDKGENKGFEIEEIDAKTYFISQYDGESLTGYSSISESES